MQFELWWLLGFPLFFALGWLAARIDIKQLLLESRALPLSYFKGLNFLLNEQPDKAIEAFIEVVKVDPQTVELHFALGSLFRRRGEVERAIRMHQNLLDRPDLRGEQRLQALYELAQDFLKAGLLDRAEELFAKLEGTSFQQQGLRFLLEIFEQEKDWHKAIATSRRMDAVTGESSAKDIANYNCELAAAEITHSRWDAARGYLNEALNVNKRCARASILLGDVAIGQDGRGHRVLEADRPAEPGLFVPGRRETVCRIPQSRPDRQRARFAARLLVALSFAGLAQRGVPGGTRASRCGVRLSVGARRARAQSHLAWVGQIARSSTAGRAAGAPQRSAVNSKSLCISTHAVWCCTNSTPAVSRRASSTGIVRPVTDGRRTHPGDRRSGSS